MLIKIGRFKGAFPIVSPRLLDPSAAQVAENCRLEAGSLRAWDEPLVTSANTMTPGTKQSIYKWKTSWFSWTTDVDVIRSPIANNTNDRVIYTGDGVPKITDDSIAPGAGALPDASYDLGIAQPASAPAVSAGAVPPGSEEENATARNYVFTYVSAWGEEGPPSDASATLEVVDTQPVNLSGMVALTGSYAGPGTKRIYRAASGTNVTDYLFVAEIPMATTTYEDTVAGENLGEALQSLNWDPPPSDLAGLTIMPNGMAVGFSGNDLCFAEPYQPHAWPTDYRLHTDWPIVAIGVMGQSVMVATQGKGYIATGIDPSAMSLRKLDENQSCVAKRAMVEADGIVLYPSPDGVVLATEQGTRLLTGSMMNRDYWQLWQPENMHAVFHEGRYYAYYDVGAEEGCLILDVNGEGITWSDEYCDAAYVDPQDDALYMIDGDTLYQWDAGANPLTVTWRSKKFDLPKPANLGYGQVEADAYPVTLRVYADETLKHTQTVANEYAFRLPGGFLARSWEVEVEGDETVHAVLLAESIEELKQQ